MLDLEYYVGPKSLSSLEVKGCESLFALVNKLVNLSCDSYKHNRRIHSCRLNSRQTEGNSCTMLHNRSKSIILLA